jgi:hypothetical protein
MIINMFVKRVVDIQALLSQIDWRKIAILSLICESMGHKKRSIYIVSRIYVRIYRPLVVEFVDNFF